MTTSKKHVDIPPYDTHNPPLGKKSSKPNSNDEKRINNDIRYVHDDNRSIITIKDSQIENLKIEYNILEQQIKDLRSIMFKQKLEFYYALQKQANLLYVTESAHVKAKDELSKNKKYTLQLEFDLMNSVDGETYEKLQEELSKNKEYTLQLELDLMNSVNIEIHEELQNELFYYKKIFNKSITI